MTQRNKYWKDVKKQRTAAAPPDDGGRHRGCTLNNQRFYFLWALTPWKQLRFCCSTPPTPLSQPTSSGRDPPMMERPPYCCENVRHVLLLLPLMSFLWRTLCSWTFTTLDQHSFKKTSISITETNCFVFVKVCGRREERLHLKW